MLYPTLAAPSFLRPIAIFAGATSVVQATVNIVLSILGILVYKCQINISKESSYLERCFVATYFHGPGCSNTGIPMEGMLTPETMFAWVIAYFAVDVIWFVISAVAIYLSIEFKRKTVLPCLYVWTAYTLGVCCMDLAGTIYLALQLQLLTFTASFESNPHNNSTTNFQRLYEECGGGDTLLSVPGLLMTMTARFYIFWLLNAAMVAIVGVSALGISSRSSYNQNFDGGNSSSDIDNGYSSHSLKYESRRNLSVIDAWQEAPAIRIPKVKPIPSGPNPYGPSTSVAPNYPSEPPYHRTAPPVHDLYDTDDEESPPISPTPPPLPLPPPQQRRQHHPPSSYPAERRSGRPQHPIRHPPPPPDKKPLRPALKNRY